MGIDMTSVALEVLEVRDRAVLVPEDDLAAVILRDMSVTLRSVDVAANLMLDSSYVDCDRNVNMILISSRNVARDGRYLEVLLMLLLVLLRGLNGDLNVCIADLRDYFC